MRKLYTTLQVEIMDIIGLLDALRESPDSCRYTAEPKTPGRTPKTTENRPE